MRRARPRPEEGGSPVLLGGSRTRTRELSRLHVHLAARRRPGVRGVHPGLRRRPPRCSTSPCGPTAAEPTSPAPTETLELADAEAPALPEPLPAGPTRRAPLGTIAGARSGDKGGSANIGVWVRTDEQWRWLATTSPPMRFKRIAARDGGFADLPPPAAQPARDELRHRGHSRPGRRLQRTVRPAGQGSGRMAAQPSRRHPGGDRCDEHLDHTRARSSCARRCARSPNARSCRTSTSGSAPANCPANCSRKRRPRPACSASASPKTSAAAAATRVDVVIICEELHEAGAPGGVFASLFTCGIAVPHMIASGDARLIEKFVRPTLRRRDDRFAGHHRARRRLRRRPSAHHRRARRRPLRGQRRQDLHHLGGARATTS